MLYLLYTFFHINILGYLTVRSAISFFLGLVFTLFFMPRFIGWAQKKNKVQPINKWVQEHHHDKSNTPTMGGVVFIGSTITASIISVNLENGFAIGAMAVLLFFMFIGYGDDSDKIKYNKNSAGLSAKAKLFAQILGGAGISFYLYHFTSLNTQFYVPFLKEPLFNLHAYAMILWTLVIVSASNAVNLTDGLDGLATVPSIIAIASLGFIVYATGNYIISGYLLIPYFNVGEVMVVCAALIGSLTGFLWFNCNPAEVFMGDSGSLSIGAFIAYLSIISKSEVLLLLIGFIFVIETLSVILQVGSFKLRKKRIFLMAPIHHHFEQKKWSENKIIVRFWIIAVISNIIALITLKIR